MSGWRRRPSYNKDEQIEFEEEKTDYSGRELEQLADQLLRAQARSIDPETGKERGIGGEDPILFEEHIHQRRRREILNENGVPDPALKQGLYWRPHPDGRKINTDEARKKHGASFYR